MTHEQTYVAIDYMQWMVSKSYQVQGGRTLLCAMHGFQEVEVFFFMATNVLKARLRVR